MCFNKQTIRFSISNISYIGCVPPLWMALVRFWSGGIPTVLVDLEELWIDVRTTLYVLAANCDSKLIKRTNRICRLHLRLRKRFQEVLIGDTYRSYPHWYVSRTYCYKGHFTPQFVNDEVHQNLLHELITDVVKSDNVQQRAVVEPRGAWWLKGGSLEEPYAFSKLASMAWNYTVRHVKPYSYK